MLEWLPPPRLSLRQIQYWLNWNEKFSLDAGVHWQNLALEPFDNTATKSVWKETVCCTWWVHRQQLSAVMEHAGELEFDKYTEKSTVEWVRVVQVEKVLLCVDCASFLFLKDCLGEHTGWDGCQGGFIPGQITFPTTVPQSLYAGQSWSACAVCGRWLWSLQNSSGMVAVGHWEMVLACCEGNFHSRVPDGSCSEGFHLSRDWSSGLLGEMWCSGLTPGSYSNIGVSCFQPLLCKGAEAALVA